MTEAGGQPPVTSPPRSWGPSGRSAAINITFDNLGEAMELSTGVWPADQPVGEHYSVREVLPRVLDILDEIGVKCTYFAEGWGARTYPDAIASLAARGHEVGYHGWLHENWSGLVGREQEAELLRRGIEEIRGNGIEVRGFRPPGGLLTSWTEELARELGLFYVSPAGARAGTLRSGVLALPFPWEMVDAYYRYEGFAPLRRSFGDPAEPLPVSRLVRSMKSKIEECIARGGSFALLFHPFLMNDAESIAAMREVVEFVAGHEQVWCVPCGAQADWMIESDAVGEAQLSGDSWR